MIVGQVLAVKHNEYQLLVEYQSSNILYVIVTLHGWSLSSQLSQDENLLKMICLLSVHVRIGQKLLIVRNPVFDQPAACLIGIFQNDY